MTTDTAAILERVPPQLRDEYRDAWERYRSTCVTGGTPEQRASAYEKAREVEERHHEAVLRAAAAMEQGSTP